MHQPAGLSPQSHSLRFGVFRVDLRARELHKQGSRIRLQEKPFQLLTALLDRPGELVTRDELTRQLWGDQTFVDFERGLNVAIAKLRAALGDTAERPRFIETVPRRGYRFIAPVSGGPEQPQTSVDRPATPQDPSPAPHPPEGSPLSRLLLHRPVLVAGLVCATVATFLLVLNIRSDAPASAHATAVNLRSFAVLPLENFSGDPEQAYLADGMTDALITALGKMSDMRVISRTSIMRFKGTDKSLAEIAAELRVDGVIEGAVARSGTRIRVTVQLLHGPSERHLWARAFEHEIGEAMALQADVSSAIVQQVRGYVGGRPQASATAATRRVDPAAWVHYLKGRHFWARRGADDLKKSLTHFQQAITIDPAYALAYAGLADSYLLLATTGVAPPDEVIPKAEEAALEALRLDEALAEAHTTLGGIKCTYDGDWDGAEHAYARALDINPNYAIARQWWGQTLAGFGRHDEAAVEIKRALEIDPLSLLTNAAAAQTLYFARRYPQALAQYDSTLELDPNYAPAYTGLGRVYRALGREAEALEALEKGALLRKRHSASLGPLGHAYGVFGRRDQALRVLAELESQSRGGYVSPVQRAMVHLGLQEYDAAFRWLREAADEHAASLGNLKAAPEFDPLRSDPRFAALVHRVGLTADLPHRKALSRVSPRE